MVRACFALFMLMGSNAFAQSVGQSAWVKLCENATATSQSKEGNEEKALKICLTHYEKLDSDSGKVQVSAALRQIEGQEKQHVMVMVPLGVELRPGMRATLFPKDLWQKVQKNERINKNEEIRLKGLKLDFTLCHAAGCTAEVEATSEFLTSLKSSGGLMVFAVSGSGALTAFPIPLAGFAQALAGKPTPLSDRNVLRHGLKCDPYFDPVTTGYSCPKGQRGG